MLVATRTIVKAFGLLVNWEMSAEKYICTNLNANNSHHNSTLKAWSSTLLQQQTQYKIDPENILTCLNVENFVL